MTKSLPLWLRIVVSLAAIWYAFGLFQFWTAFQMDTAAAVSTGAISDALANLIESKPNAIWASYALASGLGLIGAARLLKRGRDAVWLFAASLLCAAAYFGWEFFISGKAEALPAEEAPIALMVCGVTFVMLVLSRIYTKR